MGKENRLNFILPDRVLHRVGDYASERSRLSKNTTFCSVTGSDPKSYQIDMNLSQYVNFDVFWPRVPRKRIGKTTADCKVGFFEVVTPLFTRGVVFARDSPHFLSLYGMKPHITGKYIIL